MNSLINRLKKVNVPKIRSDRGTTYLQEMYSHAEYLRSLIVKYLDEYLRNNPPHRYSRTGELTNALNAEDVVKVKVYKDKIEVYLFANAYHSSGYGIWNSSDGDDANVFNLLDQGYEVKKDVWFKDIKNFGYRDAGNFVEQAIDEFNATNALRIIINKETDIHYFI